MGGSAAVCKPGVIGVGIGRAAGYKAPWFGRRGVGEGLGLGEKMGLDWHILVVCQNEAGRIAGCLRSVRAAIGARRALVTLTLNGTRDESEAVAVAEARRIGLALEVYRVAAGDKANALNRFIHEQRRSAGMYAFVDGYARIGAGSFEGLAGALAGHPRAMASTGVAVNGRTMRLATQRTLGEGGVLHGQLHALRPAFLERMVAAGIRLPIGTYRGDGLMGSMAAHDLDAMGEAWDNGRIVGVAAATYEIPQLSVLRPNDLRRHFRRKVRQARGVLENLAIKDVIYRKGYAGLPAYADDMVAAYVTRHGVPRVGWADRPFMALALRQLAAGIRPSEASLVPVRATSPLGVGG